MARPWGNCERAHLVQLAAGADEPWPPAMRPAVDARPAGAAEGLSQAVAGLVRVAAAHARPAASLISALEGLTRPGPPPQQDSTTPPPPAAQGAGSLGNAVPPPALRLASADASGDPGLTSLAAPITPDGEGALAPFLLPRRVRAR